MRIVQAAVVPADCAGDVEWRRRGQLPSFTLINCCTTKLVGVMARQGLMMMELFCPPQPPRHLYCLIASQVVEESEGGEAEVQGRVDASQGQE